MYVNKKRFFSRSSSFRMTANLCRRFTVDKKGALQENVFYLPVIGRPWGDSMLYRSLKRNIIYVFCILLLTVTPGIVGAGSHPYTKHELLSGVGFFDIVVSLDWNPAQPEKDGLLQTAFEQFAQDVFIISEGRNKIRKVYVFTNSAQMGNADVRLLNKGGRSNASISGIFNSGKRILTYTGFSSGTARTASYIGHTIAHEFGHYAYSVYDEYQGSALTAKSPSTPVLLDTPRDTVMCSHGKWQWLSIPSDYANTEERDTAQWRIFNSSAWETLVRDPKDDKLPEDFKLYNPRVRYKEFENMVAPILLTKPSAGWDSHFQVLYMKENVTILVINETGNVGAQGIGAVRSAAKQFVDLMNIGDSVGIVTFNSAAATLVGVTPLTNQGAKDSVKAQIDTITAGGDSNYTAGLDQTWSLLDSPTFASNGRYVVLVSDSGCNRGTCPPDLKNFTANSIPIHTIGLGGQAAKEQLTSISNSTGGTYYATSGVKDLANLYAAVNRDITSRDTVVVSEQSGTLAAGERSELQALLTGRESEVTFRASWEAGDSVGYELVDPSGRIIGPASLPQGVSYLSDLDYAMYTVTTPAQGTWIGRASAAGVISDGSISQQVSSQSQMIMDVQLIGGVYPEPIGIMVSIDGPEPVAGATVFATITPPEGAPAVPDVQLTDDEENVDDMADDGVYSGIVDNYRANGTYTVTVRATNPSGNAYLSTAGALESGDDEPIQPLPPFSIIATAQITVSGYDPELSTPSNAATIPTDNTRVWGAIRNDHDVIWYKFTAAAGRRYFIQTSNLVSTGGTPMATLLTLYQSDSATEIASSSHYRGSHMSFLEWTAETGGTYYVSVEHASPGTGSFAVTIGSASLLRSNAPMSTGGSGSQCFIATAAYGSYLHPYVEILRLFRDRFLLTSAFGRLLVGWYYRISPPIADRIRESTVMKASVRIMLLPAIGFSYISVRVGPVAAFLVGLFFAGIISAGWSSLLRRRRSSRD